MPDLSTVVNMFFGADNNKVRYQVKVTVTVYNTSGKSIETSEEVSSIVKF